MSDCHYSVSPVNCSDFDVFSSKQFHFDACYRFMSLRKLTTDYLSNLGGRKNLKTNDQQV